MHNFIYKFDFPFTRNTLEFKEFTTQDQINFAKSRLSFVDAEDYFSYIYEIYKNCVKFPEVLEKLNVLEFLIFVVKLRSLSVGSIIKLKIDIDGEPVKMEINLNSILKNISDIFYEKTLDVDGIKIVLTVPILKHFHLIYNIKNDVDFYNSIKYYIKSINNIDFSNFQSDQLETFFDALPVKITKKISTEVVDYIKCFADKKIFNFPQLENFKLNFLNESVIEFLKFINFYDLRNIQEEIFVLSNLDSNYILNTSPIERAIYLSIYLEKNAQTKKENLQYQ